MSTVYITTSTMATPRVRVSRKSNVYNDRSKSSIITTTTEYAPSRLPEFSRLVDIDLNDMAMSETSEQPTATSKVSTPSTVTRAENPASRLRELLARLPSDPPGPVEAETPFQEDPSERDSDYDMSDHASATPSVAQESLKSLFSKVRMDTDDTPLKSWARRNSFNDSNMELEAGMRPQKVDYKGKGCSFSDNGNDESHLASTTLNRRRSKSKVSQVTAEFLRERFSESRIEVPHNSSTDSATLSRELDNSHGSPMATSTPQQSLRMSVNMDFHSNLMEHDIEMHRAIEGLDSYEDDPSNHSVIPSVRSKAQPSFSEDEDDTHRTVSRSKSRYSLTPRPGRHAIANLNTRHHEEEPSDEEINQGNIRSQRQKKSESYSSDERNEVEESLQSNIREEHQSSAHKAPSKSFDERREVEDSLTSAMDIESSPIQRLNSRSFDERREVEESLQSAFDQSSYFQQPGPQSSTDRIEVEESLHDYGNQSHSHSSNRLESPRSSDPRQDLSSTSSKASKSRDRVQRQLDWDSVWRETSKQTPDTSKPFHIQSSPLVDAPVHSTDRPQSRNRNRDLSWATPDHSFGLQDKSPKYPSEQKETWRSGSPLATEEFATITRNHSLRSIDNTYHQDKQRSPTPKLSSPLLTTSKKRPASPSSTSASRKHKTSVATPSQKITTEENLTFEETPPIPSSHLTQKSTKMSVDHDTYLSMSLTQIQQGPVYESETDGTERLQRSYNTSRPRTEDPVLSESDDGEIDIGDSTPNYHAIPDTPSTPSLFVEERTQKDAFLEAVSTPSIPPRRSTPKSARKGYKAPSPPRELPELPTPSSSDEAAESSAKYRTPKVKDSDRQESHWMPSKSPGGWTATPRPPRESAISKEQESVGGQEDFYPSTPANVGSNPSLNQLDTIGKTPKPPGGWFATPAPTSSIHRPPPVQNGLEPYMESSNFSTVGKTPKPPGAWFATPAPVQNGPRWSLDEGNSEQHAGLLTPVSSLPKGLDPKTPGVPGGWLATPATRKSILKVRFNSDIPPSPESPLADDSNYLKPRSSSVPVPPLSPRRTKSPGIRVVDAFGREERNGELTESTQSENVVRVVDTTGREVSMAEGSSRQLEVSQELPHGRHELLARLRQGLDDLAEGLDDTDDIGDNSAEERRIKELRKVSKDARIAREKLQSASSGPKPASSGELSPLNYGAQPQVTWRFFALILVFQLLVCILIFCIAQSLADLNNINTFYDPLNPELYNLNYSQTLFRTFLGDGRPWHRIVGDTFLSIGNLWGNDNLQLRHRQYFPT